MNEFQSLIEAIKGLVEMNDEDLPDEVLKATIDNVEAQFAPQLVEQSINQIIQNFTDQGLTKAEAHEAMEALVETLKEAIYGEEQYSSNKKKLIDTVMEKMFGIFEAAVSKYHSYSIELPMTVDEAAGAKVPTYAHDTDAAADLYAMEDTTVQAYSYGNKIRTGVRIQLPEGWLALIIPRSSIGAKTPLRRATRDANPGRRRLRSDRV